MDVQLVNITGDKPLSAEDARLVDTFLTNFIHYADHADQFIKEPKRIFVFRGEGGMGFMFRLKV